VSRGGKKRVKRKRDFSLGSGASPRDPLGAVAAGRFRFCLSENYWEGRGVNFGNGWSPLKLCQAFLKRRKDFGILNEPSAPGKLLSTDLLNKTLRSFDL